MSSSASTEAASSSGYSVTSASTSLYSASEAPLLGPAQQQWIQQMIATQTSRRSDHDIPENATLSSSTTSPGTSTLMEFPIVTSTIRNVGEYSSYTRTQLVRCSNIWLAS